MLSSVSKQKHGSCWGTLRKPELVFNFHFFPFPLILTAWAAGEWGDSAGSPTTELENKPITTVGSSWQKPERTSQARAKLSVAYGSSEGSEVLLHFWALLERLCRQINNSQMMLDTCKDHPLKARPGDSQLMLFVITKHHISCNLPKLKYFH